MDSSSPNKTSIAISIGVVITAVLIGVIIYLSIRDPACPECGKCADPITCPVCPEGTTCPACPTCPAANETTCATAGILKANTANCAQYCQECKECIVDETTCAAAGIQKASESTCSSYITTATADATARATAACPKVDASTCREYATAAAADATSKCPTVPSDPATCSRYVEEAKALCKVDATTCKAAGIIPFTTQWVKDIIGKNCSSYTDKGSSLWPSQRLNPCEQLSNNLYTLRNQLDGNLVIYEPSGRPKWATGTKSDTSPYNSFVLQDDGNALLLNTDNKAIWATHTDRNVGKRVYLRSDGILVVLDSANVIRWTSDTSVVKLGDVQPNLPSSAKKSWW
jgi:hypothetical protein